MGAVSGHAIDPQSATYHDPATGEVIPLSLAVQRGLIPAADAADSDAVDRASGRWDSTSDFSDTNMAVGRAPVGSRESLTRTVETKTIVDISSLPRHASSGEAPNMTSSRPAAATNGIEYVGEPIKGVEELDDLIARMKESADWTMDEGSSGVQDPALGSSLIHYENGRTVTSTVTASMTHSTSRKMQVKEPMTLEEEANAGRVNDTYGLVRDPSSDKQLTLEDAVKTRMFDTEASMVISRSAEMKITERGQRGKMTDSTTGRGINDDVLGHSGAGISQPHTTKVSQPVTLDKALSDGLIDTKTGLVIDPLSNKKITLSEAVAAGIVDGQASVVIDPATGRPVSLAEGLKLGIVDGRTGSIVKLDTGESKSLLEAVQLNLIVPAQPDAADTMLRQKMAGTTKVPQPVTLDKALSDGLIDTKTGLVIDPLSNKKITLSEAVAAGIIDGQASVVIDPATGRPVSLAEGLKLGIVDGRTGSIVKLDTGESKSLLEAVQLNLIVPAQPDAADTKLRQKMTVEEAARSGLLDVNSGLMTDPVSGQQMTLQQAITVGLLHSPAAPERPTKRVADGVNGALSTTWQHTTESAAPTQPATSSAVASITQVSCNSSSVLLPLVSDAVHAVTGVCCVGLTDDLMLSVLQNKTGDLIVDGEQQTTLPVITQDHKQSTPMELEDDNEAALQIVELSDLLKDRNQLDKEQPKLAPASSMTLLEAVASGLADSTSGLFEDPHSGKKMPLREAIELSLISTSKLVVTDTARDETISLQEAVHRQIVDADYKTFVDTKASRQLTFTDAIREGLIREDDRIPTLRELAADELYDPSTGTVFDPSTGQRISLLEAIESKLLDRQSVRLLDPASGAEITLAEAFERGILDPDTGKLIDTYTGQTVNLVDSVNKAVLGLTTTCLSVARPPVHHHGPSVADKHISLDGSEEKYAADEIGAVAVAEKDLKTYSITDAIRDGIYDPKTNTVVDPVSGQHMSLEQALDFGLIDASRAMVRDVHSGQKVAFEVLVEMGLIDINAGMVRDSQGRDIPLEDAVLNGLMFENPPLSTPLTLLQLIDEGLFKVETSEFFDPSSTELVSLQEAMNRSLLDPQSMVVHEIGSSECLAYMMLST